MIEGKTSTGFEFKVDEETLDNFELLEKLEEVANGNGLAFVGLPKLLLGAEQEQVLREHVKKMDGKVTISGMQREFYEILEYNNETKNF